MGINRRWTGMHTISVIVVLCIFIAGGSKAAYSGHPLVAWLLSLFCLTALFFFAGYRITFVWRGALIDSRNLISLSRFQMVVWTLLVLSAYFAGVLCNLALGSDSPLEIAIPVQLWILMGISTASMVGSPLILSTKAAKVPTPEEKTKVFSLLALQGDSDSSLDTNGLLVTNKSAAKARWSDMITGEETGNGAHLDLSRIQMLFFTLIVAIAYGIAIANMFVYSGETGVVTMPNIDESMLSLIAISHGGYLVSKGLPNSKQAAEDASERKPEQGSASGG